MNDKDFGIHFEENVDQFGANTGREKAYAPNIGAGGAGEAGATGKATPDGRGNQIASGGEEVAEGKAGVTNQQSG